MMSGAIGTTLAQGLQTVAGSGIGTTATNSLSLVPTLIGAKTDFQPKSGLPGRISDFGSGMNSSSSIASTTATGVLTSTVLSVIGVAGASMVFVADALVLNQRRADLVNLNKSLRTLDKQIENLKEKGVNEALKCKRDLLVSKINLAKKLVASSGVGVGADAFVVVGSTVPVVGTASAAVSFAVGMARLHAERQAIATFKAELQGLTHAYRNRNRDTVGDAEPLRQNRAILILKKADALQKKRAAGEALAMATEKWVKFNDTEALTKARENYGKAVDALKVVKNDILENEKDLLEYETEGDEFEAYTEAREKIRELDPILSEQHEISILEPLVKDYQSQHPELNSAKDIVDSIRSLKSIKKQLKEVIAENRDRLKSILKIAKEKASSPKSVDKDLHMAALRRVEKLKRKLIILRKELGEVRLELKDLKAYVKASKELENLKKAKSERDSAHPKSSEFGTHRFMKSPESSTSYNYHSHRFPQSNFHTPNNSLLLTSPNSSTVIFHETPPSSPPRIFVETPSPTSIHKVHQGLTSSPSEKERTPTLTPPPKDSDKEDSPPPLEPQDFISSMNSLSEEEQTPTPIPPPLEWVPNDKEEDI